MTDPGVGSPLIFTLALVLWASAPPLTAHALLVYPATSLGRLEHVVLGVAYSGSVLGLGLLPALVFDPAAQGCSQCPGSVVRDRGGRSSSS
ncbi:MAG TPA: hypothetical protein VIX82_04560 [Solirubrobacteraceae bacterium]